ncbi:hypothetical protein Y032_0159g3292 [Ancylostoma ceylanicum]|uniref:Uncharacterized protein n=1 Tax=Ancylostoma ceylanicum TaxID=53326 RepID=A0A016SYM4_9BILA|nr:hypothetical protein Y032_0159g3292 [Ancylostoma ceylanicum]
MPLFSISAYHCAELIIAKVDVAYLVACQQLRGSMSCSLLSLGGVLVGKSLGGGTFGNEISEPTVHGCMADEHQAKCHNCIASWSHWRSRGAPKRKYLE